MDSIADDQYYKMITLYYFDDKNHAEIANIHYVDSSTVSRQIRRLVEKLAMRLFCNETIMELISERG